MMNRVEALEKLANEIVDQSVGAALSHQATQLVFGSGDPAAGIMLIGEAPGKKEDETGKPFVGASGRFLDEMLTTAGMRRDEVYITNIVKYRPPENRDPTIEEKKAFWPYLLRELEIVQPKVVITLGRHAGKIFIPDLVISKDHGVSRTVKYNNREWLVIPLYHPAAALYNGSMRQTLIDDFLSASAQIYSDQ